jgi:hypothetical protein
MKDNDGVKIILWTFVIFFGLAAIAIYLEKALGYPKRHSKCEFLYEKPDGIK